MSKLRMNKSEGGGRAGRVRRSPSKPAPKFGRKSSNDRPSKTPGTRGKRDARTLSEHMVRNELERSAATRPANSKYADKFKNKKTKNTDKHMDEKFGVTFGGRNRAGRNVFSKFNKDFIDEKMYINKAVIKTAEKYHAKNSFADFPVSDELKANLTKNGILNPSPIQDEAIPVGIEGKDIIGIAATGTGKTAAFLIPIIKKLQENPGQAALVLAPTRELAQQIEQAFKEFTAGMKMFSVSLVGGASIQYQIRGLKMGVNLVVGTPGRVKDLMLQKKLNLANYRTVVLDEADRMMDMGFIDDMKFILGELPDEHQSMFFSATFNDKMQVLCKKWLVNPKTIQIKSRDTAISVEQNVVKYSDEEDKINQLKFILKEQFAGKTIIFRETKMHTDKLEAILRAAGYKAQALHGDMRNRERASAVKALADGKIQALIATDVAARGIDIDDVTLVVNFDTPNNYDTYIHRIGRTGRAGKAGHALTFIAERKRGR